MRLARRGLCPNNWPKDSSANANTHRALCVRAVPQVANSPVYRRNVLADVNWDSSKIKYMKLEPTTWWKDAYPA